MARDSTASAPAPRVGTWWGRREWALTGALMATPMRREGDAPTATCPAEPGLLRCPRSGLSRALAGGAGTRQPGTPRAQPGPGSHSLRAPAPLPSHSPPGLRNRPQLCQPQHSMPHAGGCRGRPARHPSPAWPSAARSPC